MRPREQVAVDPATGAVHVNKSNDAEPIMDAMKAYGDIVTKYGGPNATKRYVGSIDPITASNWAKEWGCAIGTKEFAKLAIKRIKDDIDYRGFRVGG